jgi:hypothetical protein
MANLGKKDGIYHIRFRFQGREYKRSLKIRDRAAADAAKNLVELTIHRLSTGQVMVPTDVAVADFIMSGGTFRNSSVSAGSRCINRGLLGSVIGPLRSEVVLLLSFGIVAAALGGDLYQVVISWKVVRACPSRSFTSVSFFLSSGTV